MANSYAVLSGNSLIARFVLSPDLRSTCEINAMPANEANTPHSFFQVNFSVPVKAPNINVQILDVEVNIVVLATVVYCKHAMAK